jgi:ABC-type dipeptide/oligopeptide/nickel transport system permease subunit
VGGLRLVATPVAAICMNNNQILGLVLLVAGLIFLLLGLRATESFGETIKEGLSGRYTDKTTWYIVGGSVATIVGAGMAFFGRAPKTA